MDRRVIAGLVGLVVVTNAQVGLAQSGPTRDPSSQPPVGLAPIPSIEETINKTSPGLPPSAFARMPTNPIGNGPASTIPRPPVQDGPVGLYPIEPIHQSINRGFGSGRIASIFRRPGARALATPGTPPMMPVQAPAPALAPAAPTLDPMAFPSAAADEPIPARPMGRPAPYSRQVPDLSRPQADSAPLINNVTPSQGRPALADDRPGTARPLAPGADRPPSPRPRSVATYPPAFRPAGSTVPLPSPVVVSPGPNPNPNPGPKVMPVYGTAPVDPRSPSPVPVPVPVPVLLPTPLPSPLPPPSELPPTPSVEPSPSPSPLPVPLPVELPDAPVMEPPSNPPVAAGSPPIGTDPLQGMEPVAAAAVATTPVVPLAASLPELAPAPEPTAVLASEPSRNDPEITRTSLAEGADQTAIRLKTSQPRLSQFATVRAAAVGDQIITLSELNTAVSEQLKDMLASQQAQISEAEMRELSNQVAASVLNRLIDQSLILQEASHKMKGNPKGAQQFNESLDKVWMSDEVPPLLRKYNCANVYELKIKLAASGKSYEGMKEVFRKKILSNEFLRAEIRNKLSCDLSEQRAYYVAHLKDYEQPARMTWREVEINIARSPSRAAARKKAEDVLARLLHDENFEAVARANSDGPTASKGGVYMDMQPGSYGIPVVNDELNRIPVGQVSQVLEAPNSFHIIRVDSRRDKGPLRFDEVQDKIKSQVSEKNFIEAIENYLTKLRAKTLIRTMFDGTESDPNLARRNNDPGVRKASN